MIRRTSEGGKGQGQSTAAGPNVEKNWKGEREIRTGEGRLRRRK